MRLISKKRLSVEQEVAGTASKGKGDRLQGRKTVVNAQIVGNPFLFIYKQSSPSLKLLK